MSYNCNLQSAEVRDTQELMESSGTPALQGLQVEEKDDTSLTRFFTMWVSFFTAQRSASHCAGRLHISEAKICLYLADDFALPAQALLLAVWPQLAGVFCDPVTRLTGH